MSKFSHILLSELDISCEGSERSIWSIIRDPSKKEALFPRKEKTGAFFGASFMYRH